jgi:hypothetical protein
MSNKKQLNPHCPVPGCRTKKPHLESLTTQGLHHTFSDPARLAGWVKHCIVEIVQSVIDDVNKGRLFAYLTRWRQPEEMYHRALCMLFIADEAAIPHIVSGEMPNSFSAMWKAVNREILESRGSLDETQEGLNGEEFTVINTLNTSAHASFAAMVMCLGLVRDPHYQARIPQHIDHWKRLCDYLNYMEEMFKQKKSKSDVLMGVKNLHKPASAWQTVTPEIKA